MTKLDRDTVIGAALDLLDEVGVDGLTTRKLAQRLDVQQPALYWHFRSKRALLDKLAETMLAEKHTRPLPKEGEDWRVFLNENARSFRRALLSRRDGARIHAGTRPSTPQYEAVEAQIAFLCAAGFSPRDAARALVAISHYTVGAALEQQAAANDAAERRETSEPAGTEPPPLLRQALAAFEEDGADLAFDDGLDIIIAGLERRATR